MLSAALPFAASASRTSTLPGINVWFARMRGIFAVSMSALLFALPARATTLERSVTASLDDAEEFAAGSMYLNSSDLELTHDTSDQAIGIRWSSVAIPPGATITAAYIQFSAKESQSEVTNLTLRGQASDNPAAFTSAHLDITSRPVTGAFATWSPVPWTAGEAGANQRSPDLTAAIQEIVGRPGWASGNAMVVIITGTGHRTAWAWDGGAANCPLLHVEYTSQQAPPPPPPTASLTVTPLASPALSVGASGALSGGSLPIASYRFDFGDGNPAVTTSAPTSSTTHTYAAPGNYTVTLTVTDITGTPSPTVNSTVSVSASTQDNPPNAVLVVSQLAAPALTVIADASGSTDIDATPIASYRFNFGDGTQRVTTQAPTSALQHTYRSAGTYSVTLNVTDTGGKTSSRVTFRVTVAAAPPVDNPPIARLGVSQVASPALTVNADASGSTDTDITPIASYAFDFGDGSAA
ncbi:MAG: PKD domain-containing protein, partial [Candidatus Eiseniibacteriota bacterium]